MQPENRGVRFVDIFPLLPPNGTLAVQTQIAGKTTDVFRALYDGTITKEWLDSLFVASIEGFVDDGGHPGIHLKLESELAVAVTPY